MMLLRKQQRSSASGSGSQQQQHTRSHVASPVSLHVGDVSPRAVRALGDEVAALQAKSASGDALSADERRACLALEAAGHRTIAGQGTPPLSLTERYFLPAAYSGAVVAAYVSSYFHPAAVIVGFPLLLIMIALLCVYLLPGNAASASAAAAARAKTFAQNAPLRRVFPPDVLRAVSPLVARNRTETLYYEALQLLSDAATPLDGSSRRDVLRQINTLLENRSDLDRHRAQIGKLLDDSTVAVLESELRELQRRQSEVGANDAATAESLRQSAELCAQRLESARALRAVHGRLDAQGEVIHQALASIHFSLVRLRAAPAALAAPNLADIRQTVARIDSQTRAIEQAADEVRLLRGSGHSV